MSLDTDVEARLGQALVAFGQGSGAVRIPRETVTKFFDTFRPPFRKLLEADPKVFELKASYVLDVFRTLGRLSADLAAEDGSSAIDVRYFDRAFAVVQRHEYEKNMKKPTDFCGGEPPPVPPRPGT